MENKEIITCQFRARIDLAINEMLEMIEQSPLGGNIDFLNGYLQALGEAGLIPCSEILSIRKRSVEILRATAAQHKLAH